MTTEQMFERLYYLAQHMNKASAKSSSAKSKRKQDR